MHRMPRKNSDVERIPRQVRRCRTAGLLFLSRRRKYPASVFLRCTLRHNNSLCSMQRRRNNHPKNEAPETRDRSHFVRVVHDCADGKARVIPHLFGPASGNLTPSGVDGMQGVRTVGYENFCRVMVSGCCALATAIAAEQHAEEGGGTCFA